MHAARRYQGRESLSPFITGASRIAAASTIMKQRSANPSERLPSGSRAAPDADFPERRNMINLKRAGAGAIACGVLAALLAAGWAQQPATPATGTQAPTAADKGYSIGFDLGREVRTNIKNDGVDADVEALVRGFGDAVRGAAPA